MLFSNKHKAFYITVLITGTAVLGMFNLHISQNQGPIAETFYEISPEKEISEKEILVLTQQDQTKAETNRAFNQNKESKHLAQAYRRIAPPKDYVRPDFSTVESGLYANENIPEETSQIEKEDRYSYSKVNDVLNKQLEDDLNNAKSTVSYSLINRKHRFLPTPIYLCETSGKIVVNITVNASGEVINTNYNNASNSSNQCLIEHAIEYAKKARFNANSSKTSQIGTISFSFKGKR